MSTIIEKPALTIARAKELARCHVRHVMSGRANTRITPFLVGDPGSGKTSIIGQVAREFGIAYDDLVIAQWDPAELGGFPKVDPDRDDVPRARPSWMPALDADWNILLLDELPQALLAQLNIAAQLILERRIGQHRLPEKTILFATGNPMENRAGTTKLPSHLRDRLAYIYVKVDVPTWLKYATVEEPHHPAIVGYIKHNPDALSAFDAAAEVSSTARSWSGVNETMNMGFGDDMRDLEYAMIVGQVGPRWASDFKAYLALWRELPTIEEILADPLGARIPHRSQPQLAYAVSTYVSRAMDINNFDDCIAYLTRLGQDELVGFAVFDAKTRDLTLNRHPSVVRWITTDGQKLVR